MLTKKKIVPQDAAKPNIIPSPSSNKDKSKETDEMKYLGDEVETATGGQLPPDIDQKYSRSGGKERGQRHSAPHGGRNQPSHG